GPVIEPVSPTSRIYFLTIRLHSVSMCHALLPHQEMSMTLGSHEEAANVMVRRCDRVPFNVD
ncbi:MAG: hypothetical protein ACU83V_07375, partial [Gammaproteobacteria bacterium]